MIAGLLFELEVGVAYEAEMAAFLEGEFAALVRPIPTTDWSTVRFDPTRFGVLVAYDADVGEQTHIGDAIAERLAAALGDRLSQPPVVRGFDVLATAAPVELR